MLGQAIEKVALRKAKRKLDIEEGCSEPATLDEGEVLRVVFEGNNLIEAWISTQLSEKTAAYLQELLRGQA